MPKLNDDERSDGHRPAGADPLRQCTRARRQQEHAGGDRQQRRDPPPAQSQARSVCRWTTRRNVTAPRAVNTAKVTAFRARELLRPEDTERHHRVDDACLHEEHHDQNEHADDPDRDGGRRPLAAGTFDECVHDKPAKPIVKSTLAAMSRCAPAGTRRATRGRVAAR